MSKISKRPEKQLMWMWLSRDMKLSRGAEVGLDLACGPMRHRPNFLTDHYVGVDLDPERIERGLAKHPEVTGVVAGIEDIDPETRGDFVICIETLGINLRFDVDKMMLVLPKIVDAVRPGGTLIFNIGIDSAFEQQIDELLATAFQDVDKREYGAGHDRTSTLISYAHAKLMLWFPRLRQGAKKKAYYLCRRKI